MLVYYTNNVTLRCLAFSSRPGQVIRIIIVILGAGTPALLTIKKEKKEKGKNVFIEL